MNIIELAFILSSTFSMIICIGICVQSIKEKNDKLPEHKKIKLPKIFPIHSQKEPLIDHNELCPMKDTAENITDQEEIRSILRQ